MAPTILVQIRKSYQFGKF